VPSDERNGYDESSAAGSERSGPPETPGGTTTPTASPATISHRRLFGVRALIGVTTLLLIVANFAVWANRLLFNPDNWATTSTQLLQNPNIRSTTANYLVDQLYANYDVAGVIRSGLPPRLEPLAAPAAGALRSASVEVVNRALARPRVQALWEQANRAADRTFIAVVNGGKGPVKVNQGVVTLNLGAILDDVAARLGLPSNLSAKLPPNVANLTIIKSDQLKVVQNGGQAIKGLALWLTILVPVLYALAIVLAKGRRRRTLMTVGFAAAFAGLAVLVGRSILESQITTSLTTDAALRPAIRATIGIGTQLLSEVAGACVFIGLILVATAWFAGPARLARIAREAVAPFLREDAVASYAITLAIMALIFLWDPIPATGTPAGIITFTLLALLGTTLLTRQTAQEFPDARAGAASAAIRARMARLRRHDGPDAAPAASTSASTSEQLEQLAALRDRGAISADEYQSAKEKVLHD
jgi:Short C-terminal domain